MGRNDNWKYLSKEGPSTHQNDTDGLTFVVPDYEEWHVLSLWIEYTSSDTAGTRALRIAITDADSDVMLEIVPGATQILSLTRFYSLYPGAPDLASFRDTDLLTTPLPAGLVLRPGWAIRVIENSSGDTTDSETFLSQLMYAVNKIASTDGATQPASDS